MMALPRPGCITVAGPFTAQTLRVLICKQEDSAGKATSLRAATSRKGAVLGNGLAQTE